MPDEQAVLYEERDTLALITLNRPEKLNTLNEAVIAGLAEAIDAAAASRAVRAIVLRGAGRAFTAGYDIRSREGFAAALDSLERSVMRLSKLTLVKVLAQLARLPAPPSADASPRARLRGRAHTKARDAAAVGFHYDQPVAFYRTFLGSELVYSCAYYDEGIETLDAAQIAKRHGDSRFTGGAKQTFMHKEGQRVTRIDAVFHAQVVQLLP